MSETTKAISSVCHQLIEEPTNIKVNSNDEYFDAIENVKDSNNQAILLSKVSHDFYVNLKNNVCIQLYRELKKEFKVNDIDKSALEILEREKQIIKDGDWYKIEMNEGDIEIKINDSDISKKISENEFALKNVAIIKGEECFVQIVSPGGMRGDRNTLIQTSQEDLAEILKGLTELL